MTFAKGLLSTFSIGDVRDYPVHFQSGVAIHFDPPATSFDPMGRPIGPDHAILRSLFIPPLHGPAEHFICVGAVIGVHPLKPCFYRWNKAEGLTAQDLKVLLGPLQLVHGRIPLPGTHKPSLERNSESGITFSKLFFGVLTFRNVCE